jgi:hypothetical protein
MLDKMGNLVGIPGGYLFCGTKISHVNKKINKSDGIERSDRMGNLLLNGSESPFLT